MGERKIKKTSGRKKKRDLKVLMDGGSIEKPVHEDIDYGASMNHRKICETFFFLPAI